VSGEQTTGPQEIFAANLSSIRDILRRVAARQRLSPTDAEAFSSYVLLRMAENDCAILRRFQGKSTLRTYLVVVIHRLLLDYRHRAAGKWHAGEHAACLDGTAVRDSTKPGAAVPELAEVAAGELQSPGSDRAAPPRR
jgi:DNA-directed RNA polymerase specialized sigma24 family protein